VSTVRNTIGRLARADAELAHKRAERLFTTANPTPESEHVTFTPCDQADDNGDSCPGVVAGVEFANQHARFRVAIYATGRCDRCLAIWSEWGALELALSPTVARMNATSAAMLCAGYKANGTELIGLGAVSAEPLTGPGGPTTNGAAQ
jgi:hypothetical protein